MDSQLELNPIHTELISDFLQLTRYQKAQRLKSIDHCFTNLLNYKIREDETYNGDEVIKLVQDLQEIALDEAETELTDAIHTNVLLVQQLLKQAEEWHLTLATNVSELENHEKLSVIKRYDENNKTSTEKPPITVTHTKQHIPAEDYGAATALKQEVVQLLAENDILKKKLQELETRVGKVSSSETTSNGGEAPGSSETFSRELEKAQKEIETLTEAVQKANVQDAELREVESAVERMRVELENSRKSAHEETEKLRQDLESREDKLRQVQSNLLLAEKELEKKFQATGAYANMKKMLMQKNETIKSLRKKLAQSDSQADSGGGGGGDALKMDADDPDDLDKDESEDE